MASRTNKRWIAAKKAQQQKQASRLKGARKFEYPKRKIDLEEAKEFGVVGVVKNPLGHEFHRFLKGRKICWETGVRVDPDGFRMIKPPTGGMEVVEIVPSGWLRRKLKNRVRKS